MVNKTTKKYMKKSITLAILFLVFALPVFAETDLTGITISEPAPIVEPQTPTDAAPDRPGTTDISGPSTGGGPDIQIPTGGGDAVMPTEAVATSGVGTTNPFWKLKMQIEQLQKMIDELRVKILLSVGR